MICDLCPLFCNLHTHGTIGVCKVWENNNGQLDLATTHINSLYVSPVENQLLHYYPGTSSLSVAFNGCNMGCVMCHNSEHTVDYDPGQTKSVVMSPKELIIRCLTEGHRSITFGFNEPLLYYPIIHKVYDLSRKYDIKIIISTSGYINPDKIEHVFNKCDAISYSPKSPIQSESETITKRQNNYPMNNINKFIDLGKHIELNYTVIPGINDSENSIKQLGNLLPKTIPIRICKMRPSYKLSSVTPHKIDELSKIKDVLLKNHKYVYIGNVRGTEHGSTYCPRCTAILIERDWFEVKSNNITNDSCPSCGYSIYGEGLSNNRDQSLIDKIRII